MGKLLVKLSGFYLLVFGAFHLARFWPRYDFIMANSDTYHRMFYSMNFTIITLFAVISIIMGIGLLLFRNWARNMLLVLSVLAIIFGLSIFIITYFLHYMLPAGIGPMAVRDIRGLYYWLEVLVCLVVMPSLFLFFFTRRSTIKLFAGRK